MKRKAAYTGKDANPIQNRCKSIRFLHLYNDRH